MQRKFPDDKRRNPVDRKPNYVKFNGGWWCVLGDVVEGPRFTQRPHPIPPRLQWMLNQFKWKGRVKGMKPVVSQ